VNQAHVLLLFKFPEDDQETFMPYTADELEEAQHDALAFRDMYPETLYLTVVYVFEDGREENLWHWINPQSAKLIKRASSAGGVGMLGLNTPLGFAQSVGGPSLSPIEKSTSSLTQWGARPPLLLPSEPVQPSSSKPYGGRNRRTRLGRGPRR
jgi:hypothetical protein